jgi:hypothetical protein
MRTNQGPVVSTMMINSVVGIGYVSVSNEAEKAEDEASNVAVKHAIANFIEFSFVCLKCTFKT